MLICHKLVVSTEAAGLQACHVKNIGSVNSNYCSV